MPRRIVRKKYGPKREATITTVEHDEATLRRQCLDGTARYRAALIEAGYRFEGAINATTA